MLRTCPSDKYVIVLKKLRVRACRYSWRKGDQMCPLYAYAYYNSPKKDDRSVHDHILNKWGLSWRNGFTNALDGLEPEPEGDEAKYNAGYEEGELVRRRLFDLVAA